MRNLKKVIALVAVFAMLVTSVAFAQTYSDVKADDNYAEAIEMLSNLNILTGDDEDGDGVMDFRPNDTITRAEVAAVVCRIQNMNNLSQTGTQFDDVTSANWASGYIAQAAGQGIINGNGDGTFDPEGNVKYEQAVKMFVRTLGYEPYVNANGGYPSGDLAAANRYGILDGVVGGGTGVDATRGQIAQMAFNALETPMMDRYSYGTEENYQIYDGKNDRDFMTLLTRDFSVKKFNAVVSGVQVTTLESAVTIDTDDDAEVTFDYDDESNDYINYEVAKISKVYAGESNVDEYLGYEVNAYVKETNRSGEYEILSVAPTSSNKTASFTLDQFSAVNGLKVEYYKNTNDNNTTTLNVQKGASVLYNGVAYAKDVTADTLDNTFEALNVTANTVYSGRVVFIDNDATNGYDVISVEVATSAVVDEVKSNGTVTFKEPVYNSLKGSERVKIALDFDEELNDTVIKLTKDGKAIEYTELQEWDVLSILHNGANQYFDVRVVSSNAVDGAISSRAQSDTSADTWEYTIGGNKYDVAANCYGTKSGGWSVGTVGMFYVDEYGKIVAYDKNGSTTASSTSGKYAFVLNAAENADTFGETTVRVQLLDKSGKVFTADVASKVKIENGPKNTSIAEEKTYDVKNIASDLAEAMMSRLITYDGNTSGEIKTVTFPTLKDDDSSFNIAGMSTSDNTDAIYDEDDRTIKGIGTFDVDDDTIVFFITEGASSNMYLGNGAASKTASKVGNVSSIAEGDYNMVVYDEEDGVAGVVVVFNTIGGISPSSNIAVIDSVGDATDDEGNSVKLVEYFMDGEAKSSKTSADITDTTIESAKQGDIFKVSLSSDGATINEATKYASLDRDKDAAAGVNYTLANSATNGVANGKKETMYVGPVFDYTSASKRIRIAAESSSDWDFENTVSIKATDANVYVIDPNKKNNKIYVGDASDVEYEKDLIARAIEDSNDRDEITVTSPSNDKIEKTEQALGLMDYVFAVEYDGDVLDVVIYKAYDFKYKF